MNNDLFFLTLMVQIALWNHRKDTIIAGSKLQQRLLRTGGACDPAHCDTCTIDNPSFTF